MYLNNNKAFTIYKEKNLLGDSPSCFDDIMRSIAYNYNCSYEMFYSKRWFFKFEAQSPGSLDDRVRTHRAIDNDIFYKQLIDLQGFSFQKIDNDIFRQNYSEIILNSKCLIVGIDGYWIPWDAYYQTRHNSHAVIVFDINEDDDTFICCDPYNKQERIAIKSEELFAGLHNVLNPVFSNNKADAFRRLSYFDEILDEIDTDMFQDIHNLSKAVYEGQDVKELFLSLFKISWSRWTFGIYLSSLKDLNPIFNEFGIEMQNVALTWNSIKLSLIKYECLQNLNSSRVVSLKNSICSMLNSVADKEYEIYLNICNKKSVKIDSTSENTINGSEMAYNIDIQQYFNNCGISNTTNVEDRSDLTGMGEYIVLENSNGTMIHVGNGKKPDNISCNGQQIQIKECYIHQLILFGCCEWGSYRDKIIINEKSNPKILEIKISDFSSNTMFNEETFVNGCAYNYTDELKKTWDKVAIYKVIVPVMDTVNSITLPICPNMHIMGIQYD